MTPDPLPRIATALYGAQFRRATMTTRRVVLPGIFWRDHYDRCDDHPGERLVIRDDGRRAIVLLDEEALKDLRSDAEYYAGDGIDFNGERAAYRSIINSARATVRAIARQMP